MTYWQPIETAPIDGTRIILANSKFFAAGSRCYYIPPRETCDMDRWRREYEEQKAANHAAPGPKMHTIQNPEWGDWLEFWAWGPPSSFSEEDFCGPDYDGNFDPGEPTHWAPMLQTPPHNGETADETKKEG